MESKNQIKKALSGSRVTIMGRVSNFQPPQSGHLGTGSQAFFDGDAGCSCCDYCWWWSLKTWNIFEWAHGQAAGGQVHIVAFIHGDFLQKTANYSNSVSIELWESSDVWIRSMNVADYLWFWKHLNNLNSWMIYLEKHNGVCDCLIRYLEREKKWNH